MIPSFVECLAREGYERVQTIKIGSAIKQDGADLRAVHPKKGTAELCVNARTLTVSINLTMVRLGRLLSPACPTCLLTLAYTLGRWCRPARHLGGSPYAPDRAQGWLYRPRIR